MLSSPSIRVTLILSYLSTCTWRPVHSSAINLASGVNSVSAILTPLSRSLELARPLLSSGPSRRSVGPLMTCCAANSESRVRGGQSFSSRTRDYLAIFCNMHRLLSFLLSSSPPLALSARARDFRNLLQFKPRSLSVALRRRTSKPRKSSRSFSLSHSECLLPTSHLVPSAS